MRMVEDCLRHGVNGERIERVWFETWQYSQFGATSALPVSLLSRLLDRLGGGEENMADTAKRLLGAVARPAASTALRIATAGGVELGDFEKLVEKRAVDAAQTADKLKTEIGKLVEKKLDSGKDRIVVFIDDLDRINPSIAVEILETIKLFLDWPGCVFVLALDYGVASRGLQSKFGYGEGELGRSFFDKIIQLPFTVPVARYDTPTFIGGLFDSMSLPMKPEDRELFKELIRASVAVNPRGIKRVFNSLQLLISMTGAKADRLVIRILFAVLCLQLGFEPVYNWLLEKGDQLTADDLIGLVDGTESSRDADLAGAIQALGVSEQARGKRSEALRDFVPTFLSALQEPGGDDRDITEDELARIKTTVALSRVTSVQAGAAPASPYRNTPEFRWRHRQIIGELRTALEAQMASKLAVEGKAFWTQGSHSTSEQNLRRQITSDGRWTLGLTLREEACEIWAGASRRTARAEMSEVKRIAGDLAADWLEDPEGPVLRHWTFPEGMDAEARRATVLGEVRDAYLRLDEVLHALRVADEESARGA